LKKDLPHIFTVILHISFLYGIVPFTFMEEDGGIVLITTKKKVI